MLALNFGDDESARDRTLTMYYYTARLHCDARRPFDYCSRCSVMTADLNYPTSLAGDCVPLMNPCRCRTANKIPCSFAGPKRETFLKTQTSFVIPY